MSSLAIIISVMVLDILLFIGGGMELEGLMIRGFIIEKQIAWHFE